MIQGNTRNHRAQIPISLTYGCDKDNNTYTYKVVNDGIYIRKVFRRVQLGPGWQDQKFTPNCEILKGDGEMGRAKAKRPSDETLREFAKAENYKGLVNAGKTRFNASYGTVKGWLIEAGIINEFGTVIVAREPDKQNDCKDCVHIGSDYCILNCLDYSGFETAQTDPGGDQPDPAQDEGKSAKDIIPDGETIEYLQECEQCGEESTRNIKLRKWITPEGETVCYNCFLKSKQPKPTYTAPLVGDTKPLTFEGSHFNPETPLEPQRKTYTTAQYEADVKAGTYPLTPEMLAEIADDRSALSRYSERQAEAAMIQGWVIDIFKHHQLSRERKLELIGQLLDWEVGK